MTATFILHKYENVFLILISLSYCPIFSRYPTWTRTSRRRTWRKAWWTWRCCRPTPTSCATCWSPAPTDTPTTTPASSSYRWALFFRSVGIFVWWWWEPYDPTYARWTCPGTSLLQPGCQVRKRRKKEGFICLKGNCSQSLSPAFILVHKRIDIGYLSWRTKEASLLLTTWLAQLERFVPQIHSNSPEQCKRMLSQINYSRTVE